MPFKDLLKKKEKNAAESQEEGEGLPVFTFMRSDTNTQEIINPPTFSSVDSKDSSNRLYTDGNVESRTSRFFKGRPRSTSVASTTSASSRTSEKSKTKSPTSKRLSQRLHLRKSDPTSASVPDDLPEINVPVVEEEGGVESQWEKRATILARKNEESRSRPTTPVGRSADLGSFNRMTISGSLGNDKGVVSTKYVDDNIQEAIRLHEGGDLETSTQMFGRLADPKGENNALSQVLYGLALRYVNWPCSIQRITHVH